MFNTWILISSLPCDARPKTKWLHQVYEVRARRVSWNFSELMSMCIRIAETKGSQLKYLCAIKYCV